MMEVAVAILLWSTVVLRDGSPKKMASPLYVYKVICSHHHNSLHTTPAISTTLQYFTRTTHRTSHYGLYTVARTLWLIHSSILCSTLWLIHSSIHCR